MNTLNGKTSNTKAPALRYGDAMMQVQIRIADLRKVSALNIAANILLERAEEVEIIEQQKELKAAAKLLRKIAREIEKAA